MRSSLLRKLFKPSLIYLALVYLLFNFIYSTATHMYRVLIYENPEKEFFNFLAIRNFVFLISSLTAAWWSSKLSRCMQLLRWSPLIMMFSAFAGFILPVRAAYISWIGIIVADAMFYIGYLVCIARYAVRIKDKALMVFLLYFFLLDYIFPTFDLWPSGESYHLEKAWIFYLSAFMGAAIAGWLIRHIKTDIFTLPNIKKCLTKQEIFYSLLILMIVWPATLMLQSLTSQFFFHLKYLHPLPFLSYSAWRFLIPLTALLSFMMLVRFIRFDIHPKKLAVAGLIAMIIFNSIFYAVQSFKPGALTFAALAWVYYFVFIGLNVLFYAYFSFRFKPSHWPFLFLTKGIILTALYYVSFTPPLSSGKNNILHSLKIIILTITILFSLFIIRMIFRTQCLENKYPAHHENKTKTHF